MSKNMWRFRALANIHTIAEKQLGPYGKCEPCEYELTRLAECLIKAGYAQPLSTGEYAKQLLFIAEACACAATTGEGEG